MLASTCVRLFHERTLKGTKCRVEEPQHFCGRDRSTILLYSRTHEQHFMLSKCTGKIKEHSLHSCKSVCDKDFLFFRQKGAVVCRRGKAIARCSGGTATHESNADAVIKTSLVLFPARELGDYCLSLLCVFR